MIVNIIDKFNFLMRVTETKNNKLGKAISFDPSYISRIRSGTRNIPKHKRFIQPVAAYFANAVRTAGQKEALADNICPGKSWPEDISAATSLIAEWLEEAKYASPEDEQIFFFGNSGKRACCLRFLTELVDFNEPVTLLLHSEEDMRWIYEDSKFLNSWAALLQAILQNGGKIVIVHTLKRTLGEMLASISRWSPLYASGSIDAWYCPRLRDNIFRRSLFIARGRSAIIAQTSGVANRLNILIRNPEAVKALEDDFEDFLSTCRPLMKIYNTANHRYFASVLSQFKNEESPLLQFHATPSWLAMPKEVAASLSQRPGCDSFYHHMTDYRRRLFMRQRSIANFVTDIISLPGIDTVIKGKVPVPLTDFFGIPPLFYNAEEFRLHLMASLQLLKNAADYNVVLLSADMTYSVFDNQALANYSMIYSEKAGVILCGVQAPTTVTYSREQNIVATVGEFLNHFVKLSAPREEVIARLQNYIAELTQAMTTK